MRRLLGSLSVLCFLGAVFAPSADAALVESIDGWTIATSYDAASETVTVVVEQDEGRTDMLRFEITDPTIRELPVVTYCDKKPNIWLCRAYEPWLDPIYVAPRPYFEVEAGEYMIFTYKTGIAAYPGLSSRMDVTSMEVGETGQWEPRDTAIVGTTTGS